MIIANGKTEGFNNKLFHNNKTKGFTIIEVVLVLAIAGLIFLVVFLALPALQKSQRDNARKQDVAKVIAGLQNYLVDNNNQWPSEGQLISKGYFAGMAQANSVWAVGNGIGCSTSILTSIGPIYIDAGCKCAGTGSVDNTLKYGYVGARLENGSFYCQEI